MNTWNPGQYSRSCLGKRKHRTKGAATDFLLKFPQVKQHAYKCPFCKFWHVGKKHMTSNTWV